MTIYTLAQAKNAGKSGQRQLNDDVALATKADQIEEGVFNIFQSRYDNLEPLDNEFVQKYRADLLKKIKTFERVARERQVAVNSSLNAASTSASAFTSASNSVNEPLTSPPPTSVQSSPTPEKSEQEKLSDDIDAALAADSIEDDAIQSFKERLSQLPSTDNDALQRDRARISERLAELEEKFSIIASSNSHTPTPPGSGRTSPSGQGGEGNGNSGKTTPPPSGNSGAEEEAAKKAARKAELKARFQAAVTVDGLKKVQSTLGQSGEGNGNSGAEEEAAKKAARKAELKALFQAAFTVEAAKKMKSTLTPPPEPNKDKPLDSAAIVAIKSHLHKFEVDLNGHDKDSGKLKVAAHKAKVTEMHHLLLTKLEPLFKNNSKANLEQFKEAVEKLLADEKSSFKATPWIWHDVIRPALVGLIGVIVSIVTLPVRPFKSSVADYANSFFVKPDSKAQIALKEEADMLMNEVEKAAAPGA